MLSSIALVTLASAVSLKCLKYNVKDCRNFELVKVPSDGIEKFMTIGNAQNVPEGLKDFHGLWYMNGNDMKDEVMSFGAATEGANGTFLLKVYEEKVWSFDASMMGRSLYGASRTAGFTYKISKIDENTYQLQPEYHLPAYLFSIRVPISKHIVKFMLHKTADPNLWFSTGSWFHTNGISSRFTRIVDGQGQRTEKYAIDYLTNINNPNDQKNIDLKKNQVIAVLTNKEKVKQVLVDDQAKLTATAEAVAPTPAVEAASPAILAEAAVPAVPAEPVEAAIPTVVADSLASN